MSRSGRNCKVGDLAVTVRCELYQNLGKIVRVDAPVGYREWSEFGKVFLWHVSVPPNAPEGLVYELRGWVEECSSGEVPDIFLRPIDRLKSKKSASRKIQNTKLRTKKGVLVDAGT